MNPLVEIATSSAYIAQSPQFWPSMGTIMAISVFIGAIIYDGHVRDATKGIVTLISYSTILLWMTISRVMNGYKPGYQNPEYIWAGATSILITSLFFVLGIILGVSVFEYRRKR